MNHSFPRTCEACGQEDGVGFNDGQWLCDACLKNAIAQEKLDDSDKPKKSPPSRRIFVAQATPLVARALVESTNHSPPLGERAARAVMEDRRHSEKRSAAKKATKKKLSGPSVHMKGGKRGKQPSRSQRFANRRKS